MTIAEIQTHGHGRQNRKWISPKGGLWFSIILKPRFKPAETTRLVFAASLAVAEAIETLYRVKPETKWPNDVLLHNKKVCGILAESGVTNGKVNYVIIGIGINAEFAAARLPEPLRKSASTLRTELRTHVALEPLLELTLERLERCYDLTLQRKFGRVLTAWKSYASFLGKPVELSNKHDKLCGIAENVEGDGSLIILTQKGCKERIRVGDLSMRVGAV